MDVEVDVEMRGWGEVFVGYLVLVGGSSAIVVGGGRGQTILVVD